MEQLTKKEKELIAFSLFTVSMRIGPNCFPIIDSIIDKAGIRDEFEFNAKSWIEYSNRSKAKSDERT